MAKVIKNKLVGLIDLKKLFKVICFLTSRFQEIKILMTIETEFAKKNEPVPKFK